MSEHAAALLKLDGVSKAYEGRDALHGISFVLRTDEMCFVTGHSGAGKSTLLRMIHAADRADTGSLIFEGRNLASLRREELPQHRRRVAAVFQDHRLLTDRSVFDNVALPLHIAGASGPELLSRVGHVLQKLGLSAHADKLPRRLSTGEQQRVGIARAIVAEPALLIADEPTGNLDPQLAQEVMELFAHLPSRGTAVLIASHDLPLIKRMKKRVLVLEKGRLIDDFRPEANP